MNIDMDSVPSTVEGAVDRLIAGMSDDELLSVRDGTCDSPTQLHHFAGRGLRNNWSLWSADTPLLRDAVFTYRIGHADDISSLILSWTFAKARGEDFDPIAYCQTFYDHWEKIGTTSIKAGSYKGPLPEDEEKPDAEG